MTPPLMHQHSRPGRRVEFSPSLGSIDPQAPPSPSSAVGGTWDTETDHILSYFLGGDAQNTHSLPDFSVSSVPTSRSGRGVFEEVDEGDPQPPPTPAVQFFANPSGTTISRNQGSTAAPFTSLTESGTSTSVRSIAVSLVAGGPLLHHQGRRIHDSSPEHQNPSPISPAALIGTPQENLLLPSSSPQLTSHARLSPALHMSDHDSHQRHLAWLRELNARAKAAASAPPMIPPVVHPMHQSNQGLGYPIAQARVVPGYPLMYAQATASDPRQAAVESEEKRAKRLERNRESARKSRRKKKERLVTLEAQVNKLNGRIDVERRRHIKDMVNSLGVSRREEIFREVNQNGDMACISQIIRGSGPITAVSQAILEFQYGQLKHVVLPSFQQLLLFLIRQEESYFCSGRDDYSGRENGKARSSGSKTSSKQIGEDLFNRLKGEKPSKRDEADELRDSCYGTDRTGQVASDCWDGRRTWPLVCFELKLSVDQEEKFLATHKKMRDLEGLPGTRARIETAAGTTEDIKDALISLSRIVGQREERVLLGLLTPTQVAAYQQWLVGNRERCRRSLLRLTIADIAGQGKDFSLQDICRRLNEVLKISKT